MALICSMFNLHIPIWILGSLQRVTVLWLENDVRNKDQNTRCAHYNWSNKTGADESASICVNTHNYNISRHYNVYLD